MKIKKILSFVTALTISFGAMQIVNNYSPDIINAAESDDFERFSVPDEGYTYDERFEFKIYSDHAELDFARSYSKEELILPETVKGVPLTVLSDGCFMGCKNLKKAIIPDNIKAIGDLAFGSCENLVTVTIPDSVKTIGNAAFRGCENLETVSIQGEIETIGTETFAMCKKLKSVDLPDSLREIKSEAFKHCESLGSIEIPEGVLSIGEDAFMYCENLKNISLPDSITKIGTRAFSLCTNLESVELPKSLKSVSDELFMHCMKLESVEIPEGVTSIGKSAFFFCRNLKELSLPNSLERIDEGAFDMCDNIASVTIPEKIDSLNLDSRNFDSLTVLNPEFDFTSLHGSYYIDLIYGYEGSTAEAFAEENEIVFIALGDEHSKEVIVDDVRYIVFEDSALVLKCDKNAKGTIVIPDKVEDKPVTVVAARAFDHCKDITSVTLPDGVLKIDSCAFDHCTALESINIPDGTAYIGDFAFRCCDSLTSVEFPDSIEIICEYAFVFCEKLEKIKLSGGIKEIGDSAFRECNIRSIVFPESVESVYNSTFGDCSNLTSVTFLNPQCKIWENDRNYLDSRKELDHCVIRGYKGSTAEEFAGKFNIKFEAIDEESSSETADKPVNGDANCDGKVDMSDIVLIMQALANPNKYGVNGTEPSHITSEGFKYADTDGDGLTVNDAQRIQLYLLGKLKSLD